MDEYIHGIAKVQQCEAEVNFLTSNLLGWDPDLGYPLQSVTTNRVYWCAVWSTTAECQSRRIHSCHDSLNHRWDIYSLLFQAIYRTSRVYVIFGFKNHFWFIEDNLRKDASICRKGKALVRRAGGNTGLVSEPLISELENESVFWQKLKLEKVADNLRLERKDY